MRKEVAIRTDCGQVLQKLIRYIEVCAGTVVVGADEQDARAAVVRKVVRECANGFAKLIGVPDRHGPLDCIRLFNEKRFQFAVRHLLQCKGPAQSSNRMRISARVLTMTSGRRRFDLPRFA